MLKTPINVSDANAKNFKGQWVAIIDEKIIAHHSDIAKVIDITRKDYKGKKAEFLRVSKGNVAMY